MKEELSPAIEAYGRFRASQDYSKSTLRAERQVLKAFLLNTGNVWCHQLTDKQVGRHFEAAAKTRQAATLQNDHGVLVRFFKWCRHTGRMPVDSDPMYGRRQPKAMKKERNRVHVGDFGRMLDAAGERDPRDRALMALLLYTLMRDGEITDLRIRDLDLKGSWLSARIHKTRLEDRMPVCAELAEEMRRWLTHYTSIVGPLEPHYFLVPARVTRPIHDGRGKISHHACGYKPEGRCGASARIVKPILEQIGFPVRDSAGQATNEGAHTVRRSGARALFDQLVTDGYDHALRVVQSMLHHKSMQMTELYLGITADRRSRDEILRNRVMYSVSNENVISLVR